MKMGTIGITLKAESPAKAGAAFYVKIAAQEQESAMKEINSAGELRLTGGSGSLLNLLPSSFKTMLSTKEGSYRGL